MAGCARESDPTLRYPRSRYIGVKARRIRALLAHPSMPQPFAKLSQAGSHGNRGGVMFQVCGGSGQTTRAANAGAMTARQQAWLTGGEKKTSPQVHVSGVAHLFG